MYINCNMCLLFIHYQSAKLTNVYKEVSQQFFIKSIFFYITNKIDLTRLEFYVDHKHFLSSCPQSDFDLCFVSGSWREGTKCNRISQFNYNISSSLNYCARIISSGPRKQQENYTTCSRALVFNMSGDRADERNTERQRQEYTGGTCCLGGASPLLSCLCFNTHRLHDGDRNCSLQRIHRHNK